MRLLPSFLSAALTAGLAWAAPDAAVLKPAPLRLTPRADGALVWEAEWANRLSGSWECLPMKEAGGDAVLWAREGTGRRSAPNTLPRLKGIAVPGESPLECGVALYLLQVPRDGLYHLWMRVRPEDGCGDSCAVRFDLGPTDRYPGHAIGRYPFAIPGDFGQWVWIHDAGRADRLTAGPHLLRVEAREDGFAIDQMALLPEGARPPGRTAPLEPSYLPVAARLPAWVALRHEPPHTESDDIPLVHCALALESRLLCPEAAPAATGWLWLRSNAAARLALDVRIESDAPRLTPGEWIQATLTPDAPLLRLPVRVSYPIASLRRGHRLKVSAVSSAPAARSDVAAVLLRPLDWRALGPFAPAADAEVAAALRATNWLDITPPPLAPRPERWRRVLAPDHYWPTGTIDLARLFGEKREFLSAWFVTRIDVRKTGIYTLIAGADDALDLWRDETLLLSASARVPLTDTLRRYTVPLEAGPHQLLARVGQQSGAWLFHLEFRENDDSPTANVIGLPLP